MYVQRKLFFYNLKGKSTRRNASSRRSDYYSTCFVAWPQDRIIVVVIGQVPAVVLIILLEKQFAHVLNRIKGTYIQSCHRHSVRRCAQLTKHGGPPRWPAHYGLNHWNLPSSSSPFNSTYVKRTRSQKSKQQQPERDMKAAPLLTLKIRFLVQILARTLSSVASLATKYLVHN
jgi:hypothetical protein